ncbi:hypothetical protein LVJ94_35370 [Pendulispora rubella]|uniref:Uncharacterized protein n=1 Tax=Pendulispora rubella TaxID=2741070 RepID=A0ABZ2KU42_9BACT
MNLDVLRASFLAELEAMAHDRRAKTASTPRASRIRKTAQTLAIAADPKYAGILGRLAEEGASHKAELAGLGMLAGISADRLQAGARAKPGEDWQKKSLLGGETGHHLTDIAGLGVLAIPSAASHLTGRGRGLPLPKIAEAASPR